MITAIGNGALYVQRGFQLIRQPGLKRYAVVPIIVNIVVFCVMAILMSRQFSAMLEKLSWLQAEPDSWWGWMADTLQVLFWILFAVAVLILFTYTFTLVANLIAAPFNSLLAEKVEQKLRGELQHSGKETFFYLLKSLPKTLASEVHKLLYLLLWTIPLLLLYLIPGLQLLAPIASFLFGAWMLSLEYIDYPMGNNGFGFGQIKRRMHRQRGLALGFGSVVTLLTLTPIINLFIMPTAVAGATSMWVDKLHSEVME